MGFIKVDQKSPNRPQPPHQIVDKNAELPERLDY